MPKDTRTYSEGDLRSVLKTYIEAHEGRVVESVLLTATPSYSQFEPGGVTAQVVFGEPARPQKPPRRPYVNPTAHITEWAEAEFGKGAICGVYVTRGGWLVRFYDGRTSVTATWEEDGSVRFDSLTHSETTASRSAYGRG